MTQTTSNVVPKLGESSDSSLSYIPSMYRTADDQHSERPTTSPTRSQHSAVSHELLAIKMRRRESLDSLAATVSEQKPSATVDIANDRPVGHPATQREGSYHGGYTMDPTERRTRQRESIASRHSLIDGLSNPYTPSTAYHRARGPPKAPLSHGQRVGSTSSTTTTTPRPWEAQRPHLLYRNVSDRVDRRPTTCRGPRITRASLTLTTMGPRAHALCWHSTNDEWGT